MIIREATIESRLSKTISKLFSEAGNIIAIGNHQLKRHYVYKFDVNEKKYVIKFFFKTGKYPREATALTMLDGEGYKTPKLHTHGVIDDIEWIAYEYHEGYLLSDIKDNITQTDLQKIYFELGKQVAKIHKNNKYDCFGRFKIDGSFNIKFNTIKEYMEYKFDRMIVNLHKFEHLDQALIDLAEKELLELVRDIDNNAFGYLCHNDVGDRNVIVNGNELALLIDFEQSSVHDRYRELSLINHTLGDSFEFFVNGYKEEYNFDTKVFQKRKRLYLLFHGLAICSWALNIDRNHYIEGIELIKSQL